MRRLSGLDAAFLAMETPTMHMHVSAVMVFEPPEDSGHKRPFEDVRQLVSERIHLVPPLRQRVLRIPFGINHPVWVEDPAFDLDFHLHRWNLPSPGGPNELTSIVAELVARPLDPSKPLWEMHVLEGLESGHVAVVPKLHHAIIDGVSGAEVMAAFLDLGPQVASAEPRESVGRLRPQQLPSDSELMVGALSSWLRHPERAVGSVAKTFTAMRQLAERNRRLREEDELEPPPPPFRAPRTSLNATISSQRRYAFVQASLEDLRSVRRIFGGTVNDVLLAAVSGALRRLLIERGEGIGDSLVAMVPISTRKESEGNRDVANVEGSDVLDPVERIGNKVSAMLVSLATSVADPVERLRVIAEGTRLAKEQARVLSDEVINGWAQIAFPALSSRVARLAGNLRVFDHVRPLFNVIVSNISGPQESLWFAGSRMVGAYPVGPIIEGVGLNVTAMSYGGTLYVGLLGCRELVPEVDHLSHLLTDSIEVLVKAAQRTGQHWA